MRRVAAIAIVTVLAPASLVGLAAVPAAAAGTGSISGTVTAAAGGAPLAGICVAAHLIDIDSTFVTSVATAANGTYTLTNVPVGNVNVQFFDTGFCPGGVTGNFVGQWYNAQPSLNTANPVAVADSVTTSNINAALAAGGAISGTVTAAAGGAPLNAICVGAFLPGADLLLVASTSTAANGTYTLNGVPAQNNVLVEFFSSGFCPGGTAANFEGQWYNGKLTPDAADPVNVTVGNTVTGINAALNASGSFSGKVTAAAGGAALPGICVAAYLPFQQGVPGQLVTSTSTAADGTYTLPGAPVGTVDVKFYATGFCPGGTASSYAMQWYNNQPIQDTANAVPISSGAITPNIDAALVAGGAIGGTVTSAATHAGLSGICVAALSTGANPVVVASTGTSAGGTYLLDGIPAGTVQVRFNSQGFCPGGVLQQFATQWFDNKPSVATADPVTVVAGATTANVNAAMGPPLATSFSIKVNGGTSAAIAHGSTATLTESGLPDLYGTVVFSSAGQPNLCTITMAGPGSGANTGCQTSSALASATYSPITAVFTDADGAFTNSSSTNSVSLTVSGTVTPTSFTIAANGAASASIAPGAQATLSEAGLPGAPAAGTVVFGSPGHANLCTITLPATSCLTSTALAIGSYTPISAVFTDTDGNFSGSTSTNTVSLTVTKSTLFTIAVDGAASSSHSYGGKSTLSEAGIPAPATGTVVFGSLAQPNLCTVTLPATSCQTAAPLPAGTYSPVSALFTDTDGKFVGSTSTNTVSLTVTPLTTAFTIAVNGRSSTLVPHGASATLSEAGIPGLASGTVVFSTSGQRRLCTITLPATTCRTSGTLPYGTYSPISAVFTDTDGNFTGSSSDNTVSLTNLSRPGAPVNVGATDGGAKGVTVAWSAPPSGGGSPITGYVVTYGGKRFWFGGRSVWVRASTRKLTFTGLVKGARYHFKVRAINKLGAGAWSAPTAMVQVSGP
jgi:hypothetical protein